MVAEGREDTTGRLFQLYSFTSSSSLLMQLGCPAAVSGGEVAHHWIVNPCFLEMALHLPTCADSQYSTEPQPCIQVHALPPYVPYLDGSKLTEK